MAAGFLHIVWNQSTVSIPWVLLVQSLPQSRVPGDSRVPTCTGPSYGQDSATSLGYCPFVKARVFILSCVKATANGNLGVQKAEKAGRHWSSI